MKHWIFILIGSLVLFQTSAEAAPTQQCQGLNAFSNQMSLNKLQKTMTIELREIYKEKYQLTKDFHRTRLDIMVGFMLEEYTHSEVQMIVNRTHNERMTQDHELKISMFELLQSFSKEQKEQLTNNLTNQVECQKNNLIQRNKTRPKLGKILYQDLDLSKEQQTVLLDMYRDRRDSSFSTPKYGLHHEDLLEGYLDGQIDEDSSESLFEQKASYEEDFRHDEVELMIDLLESFTPVQKSQFIKNVAQIKKL